VTVPTIRFQVPGVGCRRCVRTLSAAVSDVPGVRTVQVDVAHATVDVTGDADPAMVHAAIVQAGFPTATRQAADAP
jgi:copper chaperone